MLEKPVYTYACTCTLAHVLAILPEQSAVSVLAFGTPPCLIDNCFYFIDDFDFCIYGARGRLGVHVRKPRLLLQSWIEQVVHADVNLPSTRGGSRPPRQRKRFYPHKVVD